MLDKFLNSTQEQSTAFRWLFLIENANKGLGYFRNLLITWFVGFNVLSDYYFLIFGIVSTVASVIVGALNSSFIAFTQGYERDRKRLLVNGLVLSSAMLYLTVSIVLLMAFYLFLPNKELLETIGPNSLGLILVGLLFSFLFNLIIQLYDEYFKSSYNFVVGGGCQFIANLFGVLTLYLLIEQFESVIGWSHVFILLILASTLLLLSKFNQIYLADVKRYWIHTWPLILSGGFGLIQMITDRWFSIAVGEGRLALLQTSMMLVLQAGAAVISPLINASYPYLAKMLSSGDGESVRKQILSTKNKIMILILVAACGYYIVGEWFVGLIFDRGEVKSNNVSDIYYISWFYLVTLFYSSVTNYKLKILYCLSQVKKPAFFSIVFLLFNILLNVILVPYLGWVALALSSTVTAFLYSVVVSVLIVNTNRKIVSFWQETLDFLPFTLFLVLFLGSL